VAEQSHAEWSSLDDKLSITAAALDAHPDDAELKRLATWRARRHGAAGEGNRGETARRAG
jgi:hypothetical protein